MCSECLKQTTRHPFCRYGCWLQKRDAVEVSPEQAPDAPAQAATPTKGIVITEDDVVECVAEILDDSRYDSQRYDERTIREKVADILKEKESTVLPKDTSVSKRPVDHCDSCGEFLGGACLTKNGWFFCSIDCGKAKNTSKAPDRSR